MAKIFYSMSGEGRGHAARAAAIVDSLRHQHDITLFEANDYVGGHTHTHNIVHAGRNYAVDSGFIVFNDRTYPHFISLLQQLGVVAQPTTMSFSVSCARTGMEYNGGSLNGLFAQRRNLLRPRFYAMLRDILRFNQEARRFLDSGDETSSLGDFLHAAGFGRELIEHYVIPMGAAIWSADPAHMFAFPAYFFLRFCDNHGLLSINDRPQWFELIFTQRYPDDTFREHIDVRKKRLGGVGYFAHDRVRR